MTVGTNDRQSCGPMADPLISGPRPTSKIICALSLGWSIMLTTEGETRAIRKADASGKQRIGHVPSVPVVPSSHQQYGHSIGGAS